jgi:hypothetical protein
MLLLYRFFLLVPVLVKGFLIFQIFSSTTCPTFYLFRKCMPDHFDKSKGARGAQEAGRLIASMAGCCVLSRSVGINHLLIFSSLSFCPILFISSLDSAIYVYIFNPIFLKQVLCRNVSDYRR